MSPDRRIPALRPPASGGRWTVARIAADPEGAAREIGALVDSRNAWHRKADAAEAETRRIRRLAGTLNIGP